MITRLSDNHFPEHTVSLSSMLDRLSIQFHALGGSSGIQILPTQRTLWNARPSFLTRVANLGEKAELAWRDEQSIRLPAEIALFPSTKLNQKMYLWLLLLLSRSGGQKNWLVDNQALVKDVLTTYPGIASIYKELVSHHLTYRIKNSEIRKALKPDEALVQRALLEPGTVDGYIESPLQLPPVPLWLHPEAPDLSPIHRKATEATSDGLSKSSKKKLKEKHRKKAETVEEQDGRNGLIAFRLESMFSWSEFINVDRTADDKDEDDAEQTANDMDVISISESPQTVSSSLKFDLDLPPAINDDKVILDGILLPEWDYKRQQLIENKCALKIMESSDAKPCKIPKHLRSEARLLRAQFEYLKPEKHWLKNQLDGNELDIDNLIRYQTDVNRGQVTKTPGLFKSLQHDLRDLSCLLLADLSLSTDAWINNDARVIDIIQDSLFLFSSALDATGDRYAISGFSSVKNTHVRYHQIKNFNEKLSDTIRGKINAIKPGYYTRMGAGVRQATKQLLTQKTAQRLLLLVTDGKPNDIDQYEGRYGIEDTRQALLEARKKGLQTFCITIDEDANQYLPYLFGQENYILVKKAEELPKKLLKLYLRLTS